MNQRAGKNDQAALTAWDPEQSLRRREAAEAKWSRGFLRSRPERWFPGFSAQWLPLAHALGVEAKVQEVKAVMASPKNQASQFAGTVDDEPVRISFDSESASGIASLIVPGANPQAQKIVLEYMARRLLGSLALSWSGPQSSVVRFEPDLDPAGIREVGAIRLDLVLNQTACTVWISLGARLIERLDGLWRRQIQSTAKEQASSAVLVEVAQLAVPTAMVEEYTRPGTVIDLEVPVSTNVVLRIGDKAWGAASLCQIDGGIAIEMLPGQGATQSIPKDAVRLSIVFGAFSADAMLLAELSQAGAIQPTGLTITDEVMLVARGQTVARGTLGIYQGRFAVTVN